MSGYKDNRQFEYEVKYLRKILTDIGGNIKLPYSLDADVMRARLDTVTQEAKPHIARSAVRFLRLRLFSLQSAVSYAVAFVLIMAVAYGMRLNGGYIDGSIALKSAQSNTAATGNDMNSAAEVFSAEPPVDFVSEAASENENTSGEVSSDMSSEKFASSQQPSDILKSDDPVGIGGGAKAITLGQDDSFVYLYRLNEANDPDKKGFPITMEIIEAESGKHSAFVDIPDISEPPLAFYSASGVICLIGCSENGIIARVYSASSENEIIFWSETVVFAQPGEYIDSRYVNGFLYITVNPGEGYDGETLMLPDAAENSMRAITALDTQTGEMSYIVLSGADKDVSMHDWNIYVSYTAISGNGMEDVLEMVQIKLDGLNMEIVSVP